MPLATAFASPIRVDLYLNDAGLPRLTEADLAVGRQPERLEPVARFRVEPGVMEPCDGAWPEVTERNDVRRHAEDPITEMRPVSFWGRRAGHAGHWAIGLLGYWVIGSLVIAIGSLRRSVATLDQWPNGPMTNNPIPNNPITQWPNNPLAQLCDLLRSSGRLVFRNQPLDHHDVAPLAIEIAVPLVDPDVAKPHGATQRAARGVEREDA